MHNYRFRRQFPIGQYIVDFICLERRLIVEVDGGHHSEQLESDAIRAQWLERQGFRLLRFWNNEVQSNLPGVKESIYNALRQLPPTPTLPARGEGVTMFKKIQRIPFRRDRGSGMSGIAEVLI